MSIIFYNILHVISLLVLFGGTFYAFAGPPGSRKPVLIITGIASLLMLISGVGMMHKMSYAWSGWPIIKIVCWLGLSALAGVGYRRRGAVPALACGAVLLAAIAVYAVYTKPMF